MFEKRRRPPEDPLAADLDLIDSVWGPAGWFLTATEEVLRDNADVAYHEQRRQEARAISAARRAELRDALFARHARRP